ncbi:hypothetical protein BC629DRAFT_557772 [Irpex lacteus]|nr:hypothetical protein BC629DRAFT_557772 [Irpex lacteus]
MDTQNHPTEDDLLPSFEPGLAIGQRGSTTSRARATTSHGSSATTGADPNVKSIDEIPSGGALIPPELFRSILWWIAHNDDVGEVLNSHISSLAGGLFDWDLYLEEQERVKPLSNLKSCSLVCRYWANRARVFLFKDRHLHINSLEMAQAFRKYTVAGCRDLVPLWTLIRDVHVTVEYSKASRSYLDIVYTPQIRDKLLSLTMGITLQGLSVIPRLGAHSTVHTGASRISLLLPPLPPHTRR